MKSDILTRGPGYHAGEASMRKIASAAILTSLFLAAHSFAAHLFPGQDHNDNGAITGRVTVDGKPARGVIVIAVLSGSSDPSKIIERMFNSPKSPKAETDSDGHYRIEGLPAGNYEVGPSAPTMVNTSNDGYQKVSIAGGATVEGIDFSLSRGGVITGKVTDSEGRPLIGESISIKATDNSKRSVSTPNIDPRMYVTDDRGVYRIFGVPPGKYIVSSGSGGSDMLALMGQRPKRVQTYYPGVADEARARPVDVTAGSETAVDIKLIAPDKGFSVSGLVIDGETGKPISDAMVAYSPAPQQRSGDVDRDESSFFGSGGMTTTNARGEFRFESLAPGSYKAQVESLGILTGASGFFADPINFEVQSSNVVKLEIKVHQGASISGVVVIDNGDASEAFNQLVPVMLYASNGDHSSATAARISADSSFRISGLKPGLVKIGPLPYAAQKFSLLRVERDGIEQPDGIDVQPNEQISGVRVIITPANCVIRGHVTIQGDPQGASVWVSARSLKGEMVGSNGSTRVDAKGDFVIENLAPGDYEVEAGVMRPGTGPERNVSTKQLVTVTNGAPAEVNVVLNLNQ